VLERERTSYDYERVFWGSVYGVGLVGLGWVALKLGRLVQVAQDPVGALNDAEYRLIVRYVEEEPFADVGGLTAHRQTIMDFRDDPYLYEDWKAAYAQAKASAPPEIRVLDVVDRAFGRFGPVIPAGIVGFNILSEKVRVKRLERELG
jgi:hypothetical protein